MHASRRIRQRMRAPSDPAFSLRHLWRSYESSLRKRPLLVKCATSAIGFALGDLIAQSAVRKRGVEFVWDAARTGRMSMFGAFVQAPTGHIWYNFLDSSVYPKNPIAPT